MESESDSVVGKAGWMDKALGMRLQEIRKQVGMTQEELGRILKMSFQQIQKYEKGVNRISAARLYTISRALQVPYDLFFENLKKKETSCLLGEEKSVYNQSLGEDEKDEILQLFEEIPSSRARKSIIKGLRDLSHAFRQ